MRHSLPVAMNRWTACALVALALASGCSKSNPVDPSPSSSSQGVVMFGFQDQSITITHMLDPGTPAEPLDDRVTGTETYSFGGDTTSAILQVIDNTPANAMRPYRREGTDSFRRFLDYDVRSTDRQVGFDTDLFQLRDSQGQIGRSEYFATALVNGNETVNTPSTNTVKPWGRAQETILLSIGNLQRDSVLSLSFSLDPRAVIYVLEVLNYNDVVNQKSLNLATATPMPVALPHQYSTWGFVQPGQNTTVRIPYYHVPFVKGWFPQTKLVRVTGLDAEGRVVARPRTDFLQRATGRDDFGNNLYELDPLGGWVITLDPYPRGYGRPQAVGGPVPGVLTADQVDRMIGGVPATGALQSLDPAQREITRLAQTRTAAAAPRIGLGQSLPAGILRSNR